MKDFHRERHTTLAALFDWLDQAITAAFLLDGARAAPYLMTRREVVHAFDELS
ncbi:hypothetical protein [Paraburkholderia sp. DHOC27]|uniref:hypothetical protein n=1 Tax=Paraburkholderia sp. DHOC27 TaxID=2303330 RepID=UPI0015F33A55|nr:hypothetical protein [Paraburkholderia sp. DHOC27]